VSLADLSNLAQVIATLVVVIGLIFGVVQVRELTRQRRETAAIQLANAFANPEFSRAFRQVLELPSGARADEVRKRGLEDAAFLVSLTIEAAAIMVHRRIVDIDLVWELMGGVVLSTRDRLADWSDAYRHAAGTEKFNEWNQWLADRLREHVAQAGTAGAFRRFEQWRP
jgi:hypothetical protein